jgi:hypothetical protein
MGVIFSQGDILGRGDLDAFFQNSLGNPQNLFEITYAIYYVTPVTEVEVLIGSAARVPVNPAVGEYYAALQVPASAAAGDYRIRWTFREFAGAPQQLIVQEWGVVLAGTTTGTSTFSTGETEMIWKLRVFLRDSNPDRNYHFRPPEAEGSVGQYNQVFGQIWEDDELLMYLEAALDWFNMFPPETEAYSTLDLLLQRKPVWRTAIITGAIAHACTALALNWISDEFSVEENTNIKVHLDSDYSLAIPIGELWDIIYGDTK